MLAASHPAATHDPIRLAALDALRGVAILGMVAFHLQWDLTNFDLVTPGATAALGWFLFGRVVTCLFLGLVGVNLVLATRLGLSPRRFLRRLALVVAAAASVSLGTWLAMPEGFVRFGILHCIALSSVLALPLLRAPWWLVAALAAGLLVGRDGLAGPGFDHPGWYWLGLSETVPWAADYVPLFPWFGVVLVGVLLGRVLLPGLERWRWPRWQGSGRVARGLSWAGRWSLPIYLLHQPLLIGALSLIPPRLVPADAMATRYATNCEAEGHAPPVCRAYAICVLAALPDQATLVRAANRHSLTPDQAWSWQQAVDGCAARLLTP